MIDNKTSLLVPYQLPEFVRDNPDYQNFTLFVRAYYEWMELANTANALSTTANSSNQGVTHASRNLLKFDDIDNTIDDFTDYFVNEFLPFFPKDTSIDKQQAIKIARQLYRVKGTPASYEFLFRVLYNSDFSLFYTKDAVLRASDGEWYVAKSLKLGTTSENFLNIDNLRIFGETSKSLATIETSVVSGNKTEVFISNIERLFQSGEYVRIVDTNNQDVYFKDGQQVSSTTPGAVVLRAKVVGQLSSVTLDKNNRGNFYAAGDPVIISGGLNPEVLYPVEAAAEVGVVKTGSIERINVLNGGYGYSPSPNTQIVFTGGNKISPSRDAQAYIPESGINPIGVANVSMIPIDAISPKLTLTIGSTDYGFSNVASANANTTLLSALTFTSFSTYPISSVLVTDSGNGYREKPTVTPYSTYPSDYTELSSSTDSEDFPSLAKLGILSPIQIVNGGQDYANGDAIVFTGGSGRGAYANVTVNSTGAIVSVDYYEDTLRRYPLGGTGYKTSDLPTLSVTTSLGSNAVLTVPGVLGSGAILDTTTDNAGEIVSIKLTNYGEDYVATPNVSLKVMDIVVTGVDETNLPTKGQIVYQGDYGPLQASFFAYYDSIELLQHSSIQSNSVYRMRVYDYTAMPDSSKVVHFEDVEDFLLSDLENPEYHPTWNMYGAKFSDVYDNNGVRKYGDGTAKATAKFLNGLVVSEGQYLNSKGQPSSFSVLQNENYNNYTYQITVEKEIAKYRDILFGLLHPTGMKVIGRYALKSNNDFGYTTQQATYQGQPLRVYAGNTAYITMASSNTNMSNNIITFNNMPEDANEDGSRSVVLSDFLTIGESRIAITTTNGPHVDAKIISINDDANTAVLESNVWLTYGNVSTITAEAGSNAINITALTGKYDIINNGVYTDANVPLRDIVFAGDTVYVENNSSLIVKTVDYTNGIIYTTTNLSDNANSLMTVTRKFIANTNLLFDQIKIYGPLGTQYSSPVLLTEDEVQITTEDELTILVG
jgi:hypothetical protein